MNRDNGSIITAIFSRYLENAFSGISALTRNDTREQDKLLDEIKERYHFTADDEELLEDGIIGEMMLISEYTGFSNGFKLAVRLLAEAHSNMI